jgi:hypothetical protein
VDLFRESLRLQLIRELPEFVEIDTRLEPKGMGNRLSAPDDVGSRSPRTNQRELFDSPLP